MAILEKIGAVIFGVALVCLVFRLKYLSMLDTEEKRNCKSGLQGFLKRID